jgi:hypothetical protein
MLCGIDQLLERHGIAPKRTGAQLELITGCDENVVANEPPQVMKRLPQGSPCFLFGQLGPEKRQERVATNRTATGSEREVGEESDPLGLNRGGRGVASVAEKSDATESKELAHAWEWRRLS